MMSTIDGNIKASRHRNYELVERFVGMSGAQRSTRNVIQVINALNIKRNMPIALDKGEVAARILAFR
jgi:pyruvate/oxaloacetate carboxyltransferase